MTTTESWLQTKRDAEVAFVLVFDGINLIHTSSSDVSGIQTAWAATDWTTVKSGLDIISSTGQSINLFEPEIAADDVSLSIVDYDGTVSSNFFRTVNSSGNETFLTASLAANATTMTVKDVTGFASSGTLYVGHEAIPYTGIDTANKQFTGLTRGKWSIFGTNSTPNNYGRAHQISDVVVPNVNVAPKVTDFVEASKTYNRIVGLYVTHKEAGAWATKANAKLLWAGRIKSYADAGNGIITFNATSVMELFKQVLLGSQFTAKVEDGVEITSERTDFRIDVKAGDTIGTAISYQALGTLTSGVFLSPYELVDKLNQQFDTWTAPASGPVINADHKWHIGIFQHPTGIIRTKIEVKLATALANTPDVDKFHFYLNGDLLTQLGFEWKEEVRSTNNKPMGRVELKRWTSTEYSVSATKPPRLFNHTNIATTSIDSDFVVKDAVGTWRNQSSLPPVWGAGTQNLAEGFVKIGDQDILAVSYDDTNTFTIRGSYSPVRDENEGGSWTTLEDASTTPTVKQVWIDSRKASDIFLEFILSTGSAGYNDSTFDTLPAGFGPAIPYQMIDVNSFKALTSDYEMFLEKPTSLKELLETVLAVHNRYLVFKNGKITVTPAGFDSPVVEDVINMDKTSMAVKTDRATIEYSTEGLINSVVFKFYPTVNTDYGRNFHLKEEANLELVAPHSVSAYSQKRTLELDGRGIADPETFITYTAVPALSYFTEPVAVINRTFNYNFVHVVPGDIVRLTDDNLVDPRTGTHGVSGLACWVMSTKFNWQTGEGQIKLAFLPTHDASRYATWSPSAKVTSSAVVSNKLEVTCVAREFSRSSDSVDVASFAANDVCRVFQADVESSTEYSVTIQSVDSSTNKITFTSDPVPGALSSSYTWIVESAPISQVQTSQRADAYIADDADLSTGRTAKDFYIWAKAAGRYFATWNESVTYTDQFVRPDIDFGVEGEPLSARKGWYLLRSLNNLLGRKLNNAPIAEGYQPSVVTNATSTYKLCYGPVLVPLYGVNPLNSAVRDYKVKVYYSIPGTGDNIGVCKIVSAQKLVSGTSDSATSYAGANSTATNINLAGTSGALTWSSEGTVTPTFTIRDTPFCWVTAEIKSNTGATVTFRGISMIEDEP